jgi:hypothetical protein
MISACPEIQVEQGSKLLAEGMKVKGGIKL